MKVEQSSDSRLSQNEERSSKTDILVDGSAMEGKIGDVLTAINSMKDDVKHANDSINRAKTFFINLAIAFGQSESFFIDTESKVKMLEDKIGGMEEALKQLGSCSIKSEEELEKEIDAAFEKGKKFAVDELSAMLLRKEEQVRSECNAALFKFQEEARLARESAVEKAKQDTRKELEASVVKSMEESSRQLQHLKMLTAAMTLNDCSTASPITATTVYKSENAIVPYVKGDDLSLSFETICAELHRHTNNYLATLNHEYRVEISAVSNMVKFHKLLHSLLSSSTREMQAVEAQEIINGIFLKDDHNIAPTTVIALKKAISLIGPGHIEYRDLLRLLINYNVGINEQVKLAGYVDSSALVDLLQTAIERQTEARKILHGWEFKVDGSGGKFLMNPILHLVLPPPGA